MEFLDKPNFQAGATVPVPAAGTDAVNKNYADGLVTQTLGTLTATSPWADYAGTYTGLWATRTGKSVTIEGLLKRNTSTLAVTAGSFYNIATVPSGFQPAHDWTSPVLYSLSTALVFGELLITTAGVVSFSPSASGTVTVGGWIILAGSYRAA